MESILTKEIQAGLDAARTAALRRASRLRLDVNGQVFPVLRMEKSGVTVAAEDAPHLRGLVDLYDGSKHLFQCLIVASEEEEGQMRYEFKRATPVAATAPVDFELASDAPAGLLIDDR